MMVAPHARFGVALAQKAVLGHEGDSKVTVLRVLGPKGDKEKEAEKIRENLKNIILPESNLEVKIIISNKVVDGIIDYAENNEHDLLMIGASNQWTFKNFLFGSIPDIVAERAPSSVLMLRGYDKHISQQIKEEVEKQKEPSEEPEDL